MSPLNHYRVTANMRAGVVLLLLERIKQFNGVWLNTNMRDFDRTHTGGASSVVLSLAAPSSSLSLFRARALPRARARAGSRSRRAVLPTPAPPRRRAAVLPSSRRSWVVVQVKNETRPAPSTSAP